VSKALSVRVAPSAARSIREAAQWWTANRPKAPTAFVEELERALEIITTQPGVGTLIRDVELSGVRRVHLARVRYYLYYRVSSTSDRVEVLALWHSSRGSGPAL
jgi:plasmid stabilization system protein ParE